MKRALMFAAVACLGLAVAAHAQVPSGAQMRLFFYEPYATGDSVYAALAGGQVTVSIEAQDFNPNTYALGAFTLRIYFDPARVSFVDAHSMCPDSVTYPLNAPVAGSNFVELSAAGCGFQGSFQHHVVQAHFALGGGAVDGSVLYLDPVLVKDFFGTDRTADRVGDVTEVCHASGLWGDVSNDGVINSLDALVTLSGAVGLSTGPYSLANADVDADGQVTSRDALAMLSAAIDLPTFGFRVGKGIVDACAPLATFPRPLYFVREGPNPGVAGTSGLAIQGAGVTTVTIPGDSADVGNYDWRPRVSPDGSGTVLFICWNSLNYPQVCKANADGSGRVNLTPGDFNIDQSPDWSPAGDSIVFISGNQIWVMAADGSNAHAMPSGPSSIEAVSWQPVGGSRTVAYVNLFNGGEVHTVVLDDFASDQTVYGPAGTTVNTRWVDWNPAGDSLVFMLFVDNLPVLGGAPAVAGGPFGVRVSLPGGAYDPAWTDQGVLFTTSRSAHNRLLVWRSDGSIGVVGRDAVGNQIPGMKRVP